MAELPTPPGSREESVGVTRAAQLRGTLLRPGDAGYEQAYRVYNGMIQKRPALVARCIDVADVLAAVSFAREQQLTVAVRGGGQHHEAGVSRRRGSRGNQTRASRQPHGALFRTLHQPSGLEGRW